MSNEGNAEKDGRSGAKGRWGKKREREGEQMRATERVQGEVHTPLIHPPSPALTPALHLFPLLCLSFAHRHFAPLRFAHAPHTLHTRPRHAPRTRSTPLSTSSYHSYHTRSPPSLRRTPLPPAALRSAAAGGSVSSGSVGGRGATLNGNSRGSRHRRQGSARKESAGPSMTGDKCPQWCEYTRCQVPGLSAGR